MNKYCLVNHKNNEGNKLMFATFNRLFTALLLEYYNIVENNKKRFKKVCLLQLNKTILLTFPENIIFE